MSKSARSARHGEGDGRPAHLFLPAQPPDLEGDRSPRASMASTSRCAAPNLRARELAVGLRCQPLSAEEKGAYASAARMGRVGFKGGSLIKTDAFLSANPSGQCRRLRVPTARPVSSSPTASCARWRGWARTACNSTVAMPTRRPHRQLPRCQSGLRARHATLSPRPSRRRPVGRPPRPRRRVLRRLSGRHRPGAASGPALPGRRRPLARRHLFRGRALPLLNERPRAASRKRGLAPVLADGWREAYPRASAHLDRLSDHPAFAPDVRPYLQKLEALAT